MSAVTLSLDTLEVVSCDYANLTMSPFLMVLAVLQTLNNRPDDARGYRVDCEEV